MPVPDAVGSSVRSMCEPGATEDSSEASAPAKARQAAVTFARRSAVVGSSSRMLSFDSPAALFGVMIAHLRYRHPIEPLQGAGDRQESASSLRRSATAAGSAPRPTATPMRYAVTGAPGRT